MTRAAAASILSFLLVFSVLPGASTGAKAAPLPGASRLSPELKVQLRRHELARGRLPERLPVVVRFDRAPGADDVEALAAAGVKLRRLEAGQLAHVGPLYGAVATMAGLEALGLRGDVGRVLPAAPRMVPPLPPENGVGRVHELTTSENAWSLRDDAGRRIAGEDVVICDIDDGIDVFHPLFFQADGGWFAWIDVDGDGQLTPGVDAVDQDGDGTADAGETLRLLDQGFDDYRTGGVTGLDGVFTAGFDWLYADTDGDGRRDFGPQGGYGDADPSFGEPLYIVDDVDGDGALDRDEKLVALGSSKVRAVYTLGEAHAYRRGVDLTAYVGVGAESHGTGVAGILVGGVLDRTRVQGVAPGAEIIMIATDSWTGENGEPSWESDLATALAWAREEGADLVVHEYGSSVGNFADGSSDWEGMLDTLHGEGLPQLTATHNFAGFQAHAKATVPAGQTWDFDLEVWDMSMYGLTVDVLYAALRWTGPVESVRGTLVAPDGRTYPLDSETWDTDTYVGAYPDHSPRGTGMLLAYVGRFAGESWVPFDPGTWTFRAENLGPVPLDLHMTVMDQTGYAYGVSFQNDVSDLGTIAHPSTADSAISVGATTGNELERGYGEIEGGLKFFSGRGPRIDGYRGIDVAAPEDHYTAVPGGHYTRFGGTSGALPQVAAAVALLLQAEPGLEPDAVKQRVHDSAGADALTGAVPNDEWGSGRLLTYRLLTGTDPPDNDGPIARVAPPGLVEPGVPFDLDASATGDPDNAAESLVFRWDLDYDGAWDAEGPALAVQSATFATLGRHVVKLEVEDPWGWTDEVLVPVTVSDVLPEPVAEATADVIQPPEDVVQPPEDVVQPPEDVVQPPVDVVQPPEDVVQPPVDVVQPPLDVVQPPEDVVQPPLDVVQPPVDVARPPVDVAQPPLDASSASDGAAGADATTPADGGGGVGGGGGCSTGTGGAPAPWLAIALLLGGLAVLRRRTVWRTR